MASPAARTCRAREPVEIGHHQIEHDRIDARVLGAGEERRRRVAAVEHDRLIARAHDHVFQEPPLHRIVIDNENTLGHAGSLAALGCAELGHCGEGGLRGC
jgi:hypothetical protein